MQMTLKLSYAVLVKKLSLEFDYGPSFTKPGTLILKFSLCCSASLSPWHSDNKEKEKKNLEIVYVNTLYFKIHKFIFVRYG